MATCSHCLPLLPLLLLLVASRQAQGDAPPPVQSDCSASFPSATCPAPQTVQGFDLSAYVGKWYEIGCTGRFKLGTESGLACVFANYTLAEPPTATEGANVTVFNSGIQVRGTVAALGVRQLQEDLGGACAASQRTCSIVAANGPINVILEQVKALSAGLSAEDASTLTSAVEEITTNLNSLRGAIASVAAKLRQITLKAADLSQAVGSQSKQLKQLSALLKGAANDIQPVVRLVNGIHSARARFIPVAKALLASSPANAGKALVLLQGYSGIGAQGEDILVNYAETTARLWSLQQTATDLIAADDSSPLTPFSINGYAEQSVSDPAKLRVFFPMPGVPDTSGGPYWVVAITGEASQGYEAALVYSCTELPGGELDTGLFILSRTRTISSQVVDSFLGQAANFGFSFGCDNPFVFTVQDHPVCTN